MTGPVQESVEDSGEEFEQIAVIGLAGRFPEAPDLEQFWSNPRAGR